jgi:Protein of unknown function (DUF998)
MASRLCEELRLRITTLAQRQLAAWSGIIGSMLFVMTFMLEGWLRPGYEPLSMYVSALSLGPLGWIQIANFLVFGALLLVFARGVAVEFQTGKASRSGSILLTIIAVCYFFSGPFVMDPVNIARSQMTLHGTLHGIFGGIVFSLMPVCCFVFLRRFHEDPNWQFLQGWTLALGTISALGVILLTIATKLPDTQNIFSPWLGIIQRTAIIPFMIWIFIFAWALLLRRSKTE